MRQSRVAKPIDVMTTVTSEVKKPAASRIESVTWSTSSVTREATSPAPAASSRAASMRSAWSRTSSRRSAQARAPHSATSQRDAPVSRAAARPAARIAAESSSSPRVSPRAATWSTRRPSRMGTATAAPLAAIEADTATAASIG